MKFWDFSCVKNGEAPKQHRHWICTGIENDQSVAPRLSLIANLQRPITFKWSFLWLVSEFSSVQSCSWVGLAHGLGWVGLGWVGLGRDFSVFGGLGWVHDSKSTKNLKGLC